MNQRRDARFGRLYHISDKAFKSLAGIIYDTTRISLGEHKRGFVVSRLSKRVRALGLSGFEEYVALLRDTQNTSDEIDRLINCVTTNKTEFFRESHHFPILADFVSGSAIARGAQRRPLRIWSVACSTGQEIYSIAMVVKDQIRRFQTNRVKLLASDIDSTALRFASRGIYSGEDLKPVSREFVKRYFRRLDSGQNHYQVTSELRRMIVFRRVNLVKDQFRLRWPIDIVFCRNVLIYFNRRDIDRLIERLYHSMEAGGLLFLGHSESLAASRKGFEYVSNTAYRRV